jgi:hypothetical protein
LPPPQAVSIDTSKIRINLIYSILLVRVRIPQYKFQTLFSTIFNMSQ